MHFCKGQIWTLDRDIFIKPPLEQKEKFLFGSDVAFDQIVLSTTLGKATVGDFRQAVRVMKKLKAVSTEMKFPKMALSGLWLVTEMQDIRVFQTNSPVVVVMS